jgi:hypothetical protein
MTTFADRKLILELNMRQRMKRHVALWWERQHRADRQAAFVNGLAQQLQDALGIPVEVMNVPPGEVPPTSTPPTGTLQ